MLLPSKLLLQKAKKEKYAIPAFNTCNLEITKAIFEAGEAMRAPLIIQTSEREANFAGIEEIAALVQQMAKKAKIPIALHLDHGKSLAMVKKCVAAGYTSVHIDGSALPFAENVKLTCQAVQFCHQRKITVEAELGYLGGTSTLQAEKEKKNVEAKSLLTEPGAAAKFVQQTGIDSLAIAIGSAHGMFVKSKEHLDFELLRKINRAVAIPLVLHGASGVPKTEIQQAIRLGICKVNINTELRVAWAKALRQVLRNKYLFVPAEILSPAQQAVKKVVMEQIKICGAANRA